jgi:hypothetical protein
MQWYSNYCVKGARNGEGGGGLLSCISKDPRNAQNQNLQNNTFVHTTVANVLFDLPFRRNQPQNSADDRYIRILKN